MQVDQALRALSQMREAAPPATSARLGDMIALVRSLEEENAALHRQLASLPIADLVPSAFDALRSMLDPLRDQSRAVLHGKLNKPTPELLANLQSIVDHSASALKLVNSLEQIALLRRNELQIAPLVFSGLDLLADAWQTYNRDAEDRDQHIYVYADDPLPFVHGDYRYILAVLSDLLDNAIHYGGLGKTVRLTAETLGTHVLFSVADEGIGLSADDLNQIGQPYWRALRHADVRDYPGAGLRLHIAQQVLALHESELLFSGEPEVGSTFSFALAIG